MEKGDIVVIIGILIIFIGYISLRFRRWLIHPPKKQFRVPAGGDITENPAVELLEGAGFDVLTGPTIIPITMTLNHTEEMYSRYAIDYFVQKNDQLFVVKVSREQESIEMSGRSIRDKLLVYSLLYPEVDGILYLDMIHLKIKKITFHIEV
ncbi:hypothetical protein D3C73_742170 [compost metagenome]